jgi:hypothetical protein
MNSIMCLIKHHAMKTYEEMDVSLHAFLTLALDGDEWSASHHSHFAQQPLDRGLCGPRANMAALGMRKNSCPC